MGNNKNKCIDSIEKFSKSEDKGILLTGTHQYKKHKLIMAIINKNFKNVKILFRTNSMDNIPNREFVGWTGLKRKKLNLEKK